MRYHRAMQAIAKPIQALFFLSMGFAVLASPPKVYPTTIVVVAQNGSVFVGADGVRGAERVGGSVQSLPSLSVCKVKKYGGVVVSHYGFSGAPGLMDVDKIAQAAAEVPGTLRDKADYLERRYWGDYQSLIAKSPKWRPALRPLLEANLRDTGFVIAGPSEKDSPLAIVLHFWTDFSTPHPQPNKERVYIPGNMNVLPLGFKHLVKSD